MKKQESWRRLDIDYPESLRAELKMVGTKAATRLAEHPGLVSISMMDAALRELQTMRRKFSDLFLRLDRFRDCCVHRKMESAELDSEDYGYEEKEDV